MEHFYFKDYTKNKRHLETYDNSRFDGNLKSLAHWLHYQLTNEENKLCKFIGREL